MKKSQKNFPPKIVDNNEGDENDEKLVHENNLMK
jgi:hypothetical protein